MRKWGTEDNDVNPSLTHRVGMFSSAARLRTKKWIFVAFVVPPWLIYFRWLESTLRILPAIFVQRHRGCGRYIVAIRHPPNRNFYYVVEQLQNVWLKTGPLVADHQGRFSLELILVQICWIGRLLKANQPIALSAKILKHWRQRAVGFDFNRIGPIPGNPPIELGRACAENPLQSAAAGRPSDAR